MRRRTPLRNNARLVAAATAAALGVLLAIEVLLRKSRDFAPDFLASVLLYGLTVLNVTLLLVLLFVLGRNLVKVVMEQRRGVLGARFRMRLLSVFLLMAVAPSVLLVLVGSDLIQQTVDRWFNVDVERLLSSSQALGVGLRQSYAERARTGARLLAAELRLRGLLAEEGQGRLQRLVERRSRELGLDLVSVGTREGELLAVVDPRLPPAPPAAASAEALLAEAAAGPGREIASSTPYGEGELQRVAVPVGDAAGRVVGAVVASTYVPAELLAEAREVQERYLKFRKALSFREPIKAVYLSIYVLAGLLVLFGSTWLALYLARRITVPLRLVADGAERIAAGERGVRVEFPAGGDEFAALIESFNRMSERLQRSEDEIRQGREDLARKNRELLERQRLVETVIESVGTGVLVLDPQGRLTALNPAAQRLLGLEAGALGRPAAEVLAAPEWSDVREPLERLLAGRGERQQREAVVPVEGHRRHLAVTALALGAAPGSAGAAGARRPDPADARAEGGGLGRGGAQAGARDQEPAHTHPALGPAHPQGPPARGPRPRPHPGRVHRRHRAGGRGAPRTSSTSSRSSRACRPPTRADGPRGGAGAGPVALRACSPGCASRSASRRDCRSCASTPTRSSARSSTWSTTPSRPSRSAAPSRSTTRLEAARGLVSLRVADDGPGVPDEDRERLFEPHFSTKKRGSGLGLAIVSRIVQEHHGTLRVEQNQPRGAVFVIELPA